MTSSPRLHIEVRAADGRKSAIIREVRRGLSGRPKTLAPKHVQDEHGARLVERIAWQPDNPVARAELALLLRVADEVIGEVRPADLVELGSGDGRRTRVLLDAARRAESWTRFVPLSLLEEPLRAAA